MPIPHLPVSGKIEAPDLLYISSLEPRFEQFWYGKGVADFPEQLFLLRTTATSCITALEKIFLIIYATQEYVPFKILPGEILSTKVIGDLTPSKKKMKNFSFLCKSHDRVC